MSNNNDSASRGVEKGKYKTDLFLSRPAGFTFLLRLRAVDFHVFGHIGWACVSVVVLKQLASSVAVGWMRR